MKNFIFLILLFFISACNSHRQDSEKSIHLRQIVNSFENNLKQVPCIDEKYRPWDSISSNYIRTEFLKTFKHIKLEPGYVLDYFRDDLDSKLFTFLYVRPVSEKPLKNFGDAQKFNSKYKIKNSSSDGFRPVDYIQHIEVDDTEDGYFELLVFYMLNNKFPGWKGNDWLIICNESALRNVLSDIKEIPDSSKERIYKMDIEPNIVMKEKEAEIYVTGFVPSWGLTRGKFTIKRTKPQFVNYDHSFSKSLFKYGEGLRY